MSSQPEPAIQKREIKFLLEQVDEKIKAKFCLISYKWWCLWKSYVNFEDENYESATKPDQIDNSELIAQDGELKSSQMEGSDYSLVPRSVWDKLHEWYGGGPKIERQMVEIGINKVLQVEVYPLRLKVIFFLSKQLSQPTVL
eukprot:TRINITY_DN4249_c0_g1_i1.p1 TRINITY_DN4249_c0_g1~~TRINITY_DN4249_c0_g1_i1.p1  ORF type:complete len:142 (-),score=17.94 TRINITY_DN4249_c0_g1_i1:140-565(-)